MFKTTFRYENMLTYCTFLQFLPTLHHPDCGDLTGTTSLWKTWKVDEETWTMLDSQIATLMEKKRCKFMQ